ncbi:leaf rust 10 disease-resistance locus receptor-like protein kinase-like 2.8 [Quercus suber]|uniref:Leaf rust 10 disease-resistance locus receptor-like protein kinase-like 2.8 n=1 Tax=Quercus suber TaxID=58331 RepID=A0AAW0KRZ3_QUESU
MSSSKVVDTTLDFNNFDYHPTDQNLTLFYGCPSGVSGLDGANYFPCGLDNTANYFVNESFTGIDELFEKCHRHIRVPVLGSALINESLGLQNLLNQGFDVDYHNSQAITCLGCEASGGICGSTSSQNPFVCFRYDGENPFAYSSKYACSFLLSLLD